MRLLISTLALVTSSNLSAFEVCDPSPEIIKRAIPRYPSPTKTTADIHTCHEGSVIMRFQITITGDVANAEVIDSSLIKGCTNRSAGEDFFYSSALEAVAKYKYKKTTETCLWQETITYKVSK